MPRGVSVVTTQTKINSRDMRLCSMDITRHRETLIELNELKSSYALMETIFLQTDEALATIDDDYHIKLINPAFIKIFSHITHIKAHSRMNLLHSSSNILELKSKILTACSQLTKEMPTSFVIENESNNIDVYYCYEWSFKSYYNLNTRKNEILIGIKNVVNYKLKEKQQYKQLAEISLACKESTQIVMATALAHEINQPLTAIITYSHSCIFILQQGLKKTKHLIN